jgi:hypothetical protein
MVDLDRILSAEQEITPSPGFAEAVMRAIRTSLKAPIRFPWLRFAAGLLGGLICLLFSASIIGIYNLPDDFPSPGTSWMQEVPQAPLIGLLIATVILTGIFLAVRLSLEMISD